MAQDVSEWEPILSAPASSDWEPIDQAPQPRFRIGPDSTTEPIPRGLTKSQLQQRQVDARTDAIPVALADKALSVATPLAENFSSDLLNTPNNLIGLVNPNLEAAKPAFAPNRPVINIPKPAGSGVMAGLGRVGASLVSGLTTPESIASLPAAESSALVRALFGGQMAKDLPNEVNNAIKVYNDPNSTTADKVEAIGNPVVQSAMVAGLSFLGKKPKPSGVTDVEQHPIPKPNEEIISPSANPPLDTPAIAPEAKAASEPDVAAAAPAKPTQLIPAIKYDGKILTGGGKTHTDILLSHGKDFDPENELGLMQAREEGKTESGFVDPNNPTKFLSREEAVKTGLFEDNVPNSEKLPDFKNPDAIVPEKKATPVPAPSDFDRYKELTSSLKGKTMDEAQPIFKEIEQIKNRNGGNPPVENLAPPPMPKTEGLIAPVAAENQGFGKKSDFYSQFRKVFPELSETDAKIAWKSDLGWSKAAQNKYKTLPPERQKAIDDWFSENDTAIAKQGMSANLGKEIGNLKGSNDEIHFAKNLFHIVENQKRYNAKTPEIISKAGQVAAESGFDPAKVRRAFQKEMIRVYGNDAAEMAGHYFKSETKESPPQVENQGATPPVQKEISQPVTAPAPNQVPSTRGEDVLKAAVEKGLIEKTGDLPTHEGLNIKREASKAVDYINSNPDEALKISRGEENNSGVRPEAVYTALEEKAIQGGDVETLRELANSSLPTEAGQRLKLLDSNSPFSPVKIMRDIRNAREAAAERRTKTTKEKVVKDIKQSVSRNRSRLDSWEDVVRKLACN